MISKRAPASPESMAKHAADTALGGQFDDLLQQARDAEHALHEAQAAGAPGTELHTLGTRLDAALTAVMRAAFAAERAEIGPRGYEDRIYRRKAMATSPVRAWSMEAQRLLTLRESHRLTGIARLPDPHGRPVARLPDAAEARPGPGAGGLVVARLALLRPIMP